MTQSGEGTWKPGASFRLTCKVSGYTMTSGAGWDWFRQPPKKGLEWIGGGYYSGATWKPGYNSAFQSRVSITADASKNEYHLQLRSVTAADTAVYYCARGHSERKLVWHLYKKGNFVSCSFSWERKNLFSDTKASLFTLRIQFSVRWNPHHLSPILVCIQATKSLLSTLRIKLEV